MALLSADEGLGSGIAQDNIAQGNRADEGLGSGVGPEDSDTTPGPQGQHVVVAQRENSNVALYPSCPSVGWERLHPLTPRRGYQNDVPTCEEHGSKAPCPHGAHLLLRVPSVVLCLCLTPLSLHRQSLLRRVR